ncbi:MAG: nitroreductase family protein [Planctomycetaceae bacterium]|nr:nitroreductase family protein [Planctomycetaceae bacterium]
MEFYDVIQRRCSVRKFQPRPVEEDKLTRILNAGRIAPSGRNRQEWKFIVVRQEDTRAALAAASEQPWLARAPVIVAVAGLNPDRVMSCEVPADPVDCAIAIDHMVLAATAEGLGACWVGHFSQESCCQILDVPSSAKIIEMMAMGYSDQAPAAKQRKGLDEVVAYERFE